MTDFTSLEHKIRKVMMEAAADRNSELRKKVVNVGRPDTAEDPMDVKSKLAKQGQIKTKIIDEASKDEDVNKKKDGAQDEDDPRQIKGGQVTVVDVNPKTNDKIDSENEPEDKEAKKARKAANKTIGQSGAKEMKEGINFGLPQSIIDVVRQVVEGTHPKTEKEKDLAAKMPPKDKITHADVLKARGVKMTEALKGNQHKIDANKNNRIDAEDFKLLKKKKMDEARGVAPQAVDKHNCATHVYHEQYGEGKPVYSQHAEPDANGLIEWYDVMFEHGIEKQVMVSEMKVLASEGHMNHKMKKKMKEEVESIDELSKGTMKSYVKKALDTGSEKSVSNLASRGGFEMGQAPHDDAEAGQKYDRKSVVRSKGIQRAVNKLTKEAVEFSAEELARIEEIAKGL